MATHYICKTTSGSQISQKMKNYVELLSVFQKELIFICLLWTTPKADLHFLLASPGEILL